MATLQSTPAPAVEYREIPDYPGYRVGNDGSVWSNKKTGRNPHGVVLPWRPLKLTLNNKYLGVGLHRPGQASRRVFVHYLVAVAFVGPKPHPDWLVRHLDGNPLNNAAGNLAWGSCQDNADDRGRHGRNRKGLPRPVRLRRPIIVHETPACIAECVPVTGFSGYVVHPGGTVWTQKVRGTPKDRTGPWRPLTEQINHGNHYRYVTLSRDGRPHRMTLHSIVARAFIGESPAPGMQVCHIDGDKTNNHFTNLRWDTAKANSEDRVRHGQQVCGVDSRQAKFSEDDVRAIRMRNENGESYESIGRDLKVWATTISAICRRQTWKHVV